jgi:hypothetical protein
MYKSVVIVLLLMAISGCTHIHLYEGPQRSEEELAYFIVNPDEVYVVSIDGVKYKKRFLLDTAFNGYLLPGRRRLTVRYNWVSYLPVGGTVGEYSTTSPFVKTYCFDAEPGASYSAGATPPMGSGNWRLIIRKEISFFDHREVKVELCDS